MAESKQQSSATHVFDLVERNLPAQEEDDDEKTMSVREFILWLLGISSAFILIHFLYHLLF